MTELLPDGPPPKRVILHWTAGSRVASSHDRERYHFLIQESAIVPGVPVERNLRSLVGLPGYHTNPLSGYAAHTAGMNSWSIGVAACGMLGAEDLRPDGDVHPGAEALTEQQMTVLYSWVAAICLKYGLDASNPADVFTHYEAQAIHGVPQAGKWDVTWLPGENFTRDEVGPIIRERIAEAMAA